MPEVYSVHRNGARHFVVQDPMRSVLPDYQERDRLGGEWKIESCGDVPATATAAEIRATVAEFDEFCTKLTTFCERTKR